MKQRKLQNSSLNANSLIFPALISTRRLGATAWNKSIILSELPLVVLQSIHHLHVPDHFPEKFLKDAFDFRGIGHQRMIHKDCIVVEFIRKGRISAMYATGDRSESTGEEEKN
jgi:hypothetical protein